MKKILWLSQHVPLQKQIAELQRIFRQVEVIRDPRPFSNAEEIFGRYKAGSYTEIVTVAPLSVIAKLCELGLRPLYAQMDQVANQGEADLSYRGRFYRFNRFVRVKAVKMEIEEL